MHQSLANSALTNPHSGVGEGGGEKGKTPTPTRFAPRVERFLAILAEIERTSVTAQPKADTP